MSARRKDRNRRVDPDKQPTAAERRQSGSRRDPYLKSDTEGPSVFRRLKYRATLAGLVASALILLFAYLLFMTRPRLQVAIVADEPKKSYGNPAAVTNDFHAADRLPLIEGKKDNDVAQVVFLRPPPRAQREFTYAAWAKDVLSDLQEKRGAQGDPESLGERLAELVSENAAVGEKRKQGRQVDGRLAYLIGHGWCEPTGDAGAPAARLRLQDPFAGLPVDVDVAAFFRALDKKSKEKRRDPKVPQMVVLDASRAPERWELGQLYNAFPAVVTGIAAQHDSLRVLLSCGEGQRDWLPDELPGSLFARSVQLGLAGEGPAARSDWTSLWLFRWVRSDSLAEAVRRAVYLRSRNDAELIQTPLYLHDERSATSVALAGIGGSDLPQVERVEERELFSGAKQRAEIWSDYLKQDVRRFRAAEPLLAMRIESRLTAVERARNEAEARPHLEAAKGLLAEAKLRIDRWMPATSLAELSPREAASQAELVSRWANVVEQAERRVVEAKRLRKDLQELKSLDERLRSLGDEAREDLKGLYGLADRRLSTKIDFPCAEVQLAGILYEELDWADSSQPAMRIEAISAVIVAQDQLEKIRACADPRAFCALDRGQLDRFFTAQRAALDNLLLGNWQEARRVDEQRDERTRTIKAMDRLVRAWRTLDRWCHDAPFQSRASMEALQEAAFYERSADASGAEAGEGDRDERISRYARQVASDRTAGWENAERLHEALLNNRTSEVARLTAELRDAFRRPDVTEADNATALRERMRVLSLPVTHREEKDKRHRQRVQETVEVLRPDRSALSLTIDSPDRAPTREFLDYRNQVIGLLAAGNHPAQVMLDLGKLSGGESDPLRAIVAAGADVRQKIERLTEEVQAGAGVGATDDAEEGTSPPSETWRARARDSFRFRRAAWMIARAAPTSDTNGARDEYFAACDAAQRVWRRQAAIDDFWGNADQQQAVPYFARRAAKSDKSEDALPPSAFGLSLGSEPGDGERNAYRVTLDGRTPGGVATVYLERPGAGDQRLELAGQGGRRSTPMEAQSSSIRVLLKNPARRGRALAEWRFRGHRASARFQLAPPGSLVRSLVHINAPSKPQITVRGKEEQAIDIAIVVDCSLSMGNAIEQPDGAESTRMAVAALALRQELLTGLQDRCGDSARVGIWAYGNRVGWGPDATGTRIEREPQKQMVWNARWSAKTPADRRGIGPDNDVELLAGINNLTASHYQRLDKAVDGLEPLGQTPLYFSVSVARKALVDRRGNAEKHLFVLTDGRNSLTTPKSNASRVQRELIRKGLRPDGYNNTRKLERELADQKVRLHICAFGPNDDFDDETVKRLRRLLAASGHPGDEGWYRATTSESLGDQFREWLNDTIRQPTYTVEVDGKRVTPREPPRLGTTWWAKDNWPTTRSVKVTVTGVKRERSASFQVGPWEHLQLEFSSANGFLVLPWDKETNNHVLERTGVDDEARYRLIRPGGGEDSRSWPSPRLAVRPIGALTTKQHDFADRGKFLVDLDESARERAILLQVVLENEQASINTPAPEVAWAEIRALDASGAMLATLGTPDMRRKLEGEENEGAPVFRWIVANWPEGSREAELRLWCLPPDTEPPPPEFWEGLSDENPPRRPRSVAGVDWRAGWQELPGGVKVLKVSATGEAATQVAVEVATGVQPRQIVRRVKEGRTPEVTHEFYFRPRPGKPVTLSFTRLGSLKPIAWRIEDTKNRGRDGSIRFRVGRVP